MAQAATQASVEITAIDRITTPLRRIGAAIDRIKRPLDTLARAGRTFGDVSGVTRLGQAVGNLGTAFGRAASQAGALIAKVGALAGAAVGFGVKEIIDVNSTFERYTTILETLEGSADRAKESMSWISDFATRTPYELDEVTGAFVKLRSYGFNPMAGSLNSAGDAAAAMGKSLDQAVEALADAVTGENERLKEFGIRARVEGDRIAYYWNENGQQMVAYADKNSSEQIEATITGIWNRRYAGAMDKLSGTWSGVTANLRDQWSRFALMIGRAGVFDFLKGKLVDLLTYVNQLADDGTLERWAQQISDNMIVAFQAVEQALREVDWDKVWDGVQQVVAAVKAMFEAFQVFADLVGGPVNAALIGLTAKVFGPLIATLIGPGGLIPALGRLSWALLSTPVGWLILMIAGIGLSIYGLIDRWDEFVAYWEGVWDSLGAAFDEGWTQGIARLLTEFNPFVHMGRLVNWISNTFLGIDLFAAGQKIIQSLWRGIVAMWDKLVAWISDAINGLLDLMPDWVKSALGITVQGEILSPEEIQRRADEKFGPMSELNDRARNNAEAMVDMNGPFREDFGSDEDYAAARDKAVSDRIASDMYIAERQAFVDELTAASEAAKAQAQASVAGTVPDSSGAFAPIAGGDAPITQNQETNVTTTVTVGDINIEVKTDATPEEIGAAVTSALDRQRRIAEADARAALHD